MKKVSFWARDYKWSARILLIICLVLLNIAGAIIGIYLTDLDVVIPSFIFVFLVVIYLTGIFYYPNKAEKKKSTFANFYKRQKTCDIILTVSAFCMMIYISNDRFTSLNFFTPLNASMSEKLIPPADSTAKAYKSIAAFSASLKDANGKSLKWKEKKKLLKAQVSGIKRSNNISTGGKIILIVLSVAVALGLLALVAALACNLSCSGSDGAAILIGLGGTALVIFLLVLAIKGISKKEKKIKQQEEQTGISN